MSKKPELHQHQKEAIERIMEKSKEMLKDKLDSLAMQDGEYPFDLTGNPNNLVMGETRPSHIIDPDPRVVKESMEGAILYPKNKTFVFEIKPDYLDWGYSLKINQDKPEVDNSKKGIGKIKALHDWKKQQHKNNLDNLRGNKY